MGGKNSAGGPRWALKQNRLFDAVAHEKGKIDHLLGELKPELPDNKLVLIEEQIQEIKDVFNIWLNLYHSLVLLTAAKDRPDTYSVWADVADARDNLDCDQLPEEKCLKCSYPLPAFLGDSNSEEGMYFQFADIDNGHEGEANYLRLIENFKDLIFAEDSLIESISENELKTAIAQKSIVEGSTSLPLLQSFLDKTVPLLPNKDQFDPKICLKTCRDSFPRVRNQENSSCGEEEDKIKDCMDQVLLHHIAGIWGEDIKGRLQQVETLAKDAKNSSDPFDEWLRQKHRLMVSSNVTRDVLSEGINSNNDSVKLVVASLKAMLDFNKPILRFIYRRCFLTESGYGPAASFQELITDLTKNMNGEFEKERKEWTNLFAATYGAVTWRIFHQVTPTLHVVLRLL